MSKEYEEGWKYFKNNLKFGELLEVLLSCFCMPKISICWEFGNTTPTPCSSSNMNKHTYRHTHTHSHTLPGTQFPNLPYDLFLLFLQVSLPQVGFS